MQTSPLTTWVRRPDCRRGPAMLAAPRGFEPRLTDPKSAVLPLDEGAARSSSWRGLSAGQRNGAEDGTRTRDPHLGKVMLYQLSHFRSMSRPPDGGAESQNRTGDTAIFSRVLYQLSYLGPMANQAGCPSAPGGYHAVSRPFNVRARRAVTSVARRSSRHPFSDSHAAVISQGPRRRGLEGRACRPASTLKCPTRRALQRAFLG